VEVYGLGYAALFDESRVLAVYRVRANRQLKRLKQYPGVLEDLPGGAAFASGEISRPPADSETAACDAPPEAAALASVRDHPEMLGFRLLLMRSRRIAEEAGNDEWVRRIDAAIAVTKRV